jgi:hypothetical protein
MQSLQLLHNQKATRTACAGHGYSTSRHQNFTKLTTSSRKTTTLLPLDFQGKQVFAAVVNGGFCKSAAAVLIHQRKLGHGPKRRPNMAHFLLWTDVGEGEVLGGVQSPSDLA